MTSDGAVTTALPILRSGSSVSYVTVKLVASLTEYWLRNNEFQCQIHMVDTTFQGSSTPFGPWWRSKLCVVLWLSQILRSVDIKLSLLYPWSGEGVNLTIWSSVSATPSSIVLEGESATVSCSRGSSATFTDPLLRHLPPTLAMLQLRHRQWSLL